MDDFQKWMETLEPETHAEMNFLMLLKAKYMSAEIKSDRLASALEEVALSHKDVLKEVAWVEFGKLTAKYPSASHITFDERKEIDIKVEELVRYARAIREKKEGSG